MSDVMMQLGAYQFSISTAAYQTLRRSVAYRWSAQDRIGRSAALQFTGLGEDTLTLDGVIFPTHKHVSHRASGAGFSTEGFARSHASGASQLDAMREQAATGKPQLLLDGQGQILGQWVIERIEEQQDTFARAGVARRQTFSLKLRKYDDNSSVQNM